MLDKHCLIIRPEVNPYDLMKFLHGLAGMKSMRGAHTRQARTEQLPLKVPRFVVLYLLRNMTSGSESIHLACTPETSLYHLLLKFLECKEVQFKVKPNEARNSVLGIQKAHNNCPREDKLASWYLKNEIGGILSALV